MALLMSLQSSPSGDSKRSMPPEDAQESPEARGRRLRREIMAAAAEKRMVVSGSPLSDRKNSADRELTAAVVRKEPNLDSAECAARNLGDDGLSLEEANTLFSMLFGGAVSKNILTQWTNQGIRCQVETG